MSVCLLVILLAAAQFTQTNAGNLRVFVTDATGAPVAFLVTLVAAPIQTQITAEAGQTLIELESAVALDT